MIVWFGHCHGQYCLAWGQWGRDGAGEGKDGCVYTFVLTTAVVARLYADISHGSISTHTGEVHIAVAIAHIHAHS